MKKIKFSRNKAIEFMNAIAKKNLTPEIFEQFKIDPNAKQAEQNANYGSLLYQINLVDKNIILVNMYNMIRKQSYYNIQGALLSDTKYGFWKTNNGNGELIIIEDIIIATERTGNIKSDIDKITPQPAVENQILFFEKNVAADLPRNPEIEKWATLDGMAGWLNERMKLLKNALDFPLTTYIKAQINAFTGYHKILVDDTDLKPEEKVTAMQAAIGQTILKMTNDYRSIFNEPLTAEGKDNFTYRLAPNEIGGIVDTNAAINQEIYYFRKNYASISSQTYDKDWDLGELINQDLTDKNVFILLPKLKFMWDAQYGSGDTPLWFALQELTTEYVFWGKVWTKALPSVAFAYGKPEEYKIELQNKVKKSIELLTSYIETIKNMVEPRNFPQFKSKKAIAIAQAEDEIKRISAPKYITNKVASATVYKASDLIPKSPEDKDKIIKELALLLNLKFEEVEEQLKALQEKNKIEDIEPDQNEENTENTENTDNKNV